ncbi:MAG: tRNA-uridine aminocarboxypropyltransferase [Myxococcaceae bacterium]
MKEQWCLCPDVPRVEAHTEVLVLRHGFESHKSTNTTRIAALALPSLRVVEYDPGAPPDVEALVADAAPAWLLYPGSGAEPVIPEGQPRTLVVLDGTWTQTRKMAHKHPALLRLPRLSLPPGTLPVRRLREAPSADARSTLEAIADALGVIEGPGVSAPLHALHATMVERVLAARGMR